MKRERETTKKEGKIRTQEVQRENVVRTLFPKALVSG
jgi:hypothetical protein